MEKGTERREAAFSRSRLSTAPSRKNSGNISPERVAVALPAFRKPSVSEMLSSSAREPPISTGMPRKFPFPSRVTVPCPGVSRRRSSFTFPRGVETSEGVRITTGRSRGFPPGADGSSVFLAAAKRSSAATKAFFTEILSIPAEPFSRESSERETVRLSARAISPSSKDRRTFQAVKPVTGLPEKRSACRLQPGRSLRASLRDVLKKSVPASFPEIRNRAAAAARPARRKTKRTAFFAGFPMSLFSFP